MCFVDFHNAQISFHVKKKRTLSEKPENLTRPGLLFGTARAGWEAQWLPAVQAQKPQVTSRVSDPYLTAGTSLQP